jgi:integrase
MSEKVKTGRGKNHSGYTTKLPNGRYRTFLMYKGKTVSAVGSTPKESKALAVAKRDNLPQAIGKLPKQVINLKLIDFMPDWLHDKHRKKVAPTTYKRYVGLMENWVIPALGHIKIVELNKHHVNAFIEGMEGKVGPRSQQQAKALLSAAFAFLVKKEWVSDNPVLKADEIYCDKKEINPLTYPEVKLLLENVKGTFWHARWVIACFYGLRQGEALGLRWSNLNLETGELQVREQLQTINSRRQFVGLKSKASTRTLQLDAQTISILKNHKKQQLLQRLSIGEKWEDWDLVFPTVDGKPLHPKVDYKAWQDTLKVCGIPKHRLHDARHTAATFLFDKGLDVEVIRRFLGNSSVELTAKTYVHHSKAQVNKTAEVIEKMAL